LYPPRWYLCRGRNNCGNAADAAVGSSNFVAKTDSNLTASTITRRSEVIVTSLQTFSVLVLAAIAVLPYATRAASLGPQSGSYEITARLELPHLERWSVDRTTVLCLPVSRGNDIPVPVLSANNPFAKCTAANLVVDGPKLEYDIVCPERGGAKGHAIYGFSAGAFSGRVAMVLGGKNMTMTEVQHARRIGECSPEAAAPATEF
jgi:hypothetical protein